MPCKHYHSFAEAINKTVMSCLRPLPAIKKVLRVAPAAFFQQFYYVSHHHQHSFLTMIHTKISDGRRQPFHGTILNPRTFLRRRRACLGLTLRLSLQGSAPRPLQMLAMTTPSPPRTTPVQPPLRGSRTQPDKYRACIARCHGIGGTHGLPQRKLYIH